MDPTTLGNNLSSTLSSNKQAGTDLLNNQQNKIDTFNTGVNGFYNNPNNNLTAIAGRISDSLGLPTLQANANQINTQVQNLPFTYRGATLGTDTNNNQLNRLVGQRITDLTPAMTSANNALAAGQSQFGLLTSQAQQDVANRGIPYQMAQTSMLDQLARQSTMFNTQDQQELDGLIAKINAGVTLTNAEAERANQLSIAEKGYQNALDVAKQNQKYIPVMGYGVYNTQANNGAGQLIGGLNGTGSNQLITYK